MINDPDLWITAPRKTQEQLTKSFQLISHFQDDIIKTDTIIDIHLGYFVITNVFNHSVTPD